MLHLGFPAGLWALGALAVPLLIHLVRRPLQVVRVGQLPMPPGPPRRLAVWRWREALKLLLRCALLAVIALALAQPEWRPAQPEPVRLALRVPGSAWSSETDAAWRRLRADGAAAHWLAADFPESTEAEPKAAEFSGPWSLLRELDARVPAGSRAVVFGPTDATRFAGSRPTLARLQVDWWPTDPASPPARGAGSAAPPRVAVLAAPDRAEDRRFVRAALGAVAAIETVDAPDWIVQLGDVALPPALAARVEAGAVLVRDAGGPPLVSDGERTFSPGPARMTLRQRAAAPADGRVRLRDSAGEPLWTETRQGAGWVWHWALRFHPDWTDWPLHAEFPGWWAEILRPGPEASAPLSARQAAPAFAAAAATDSPALPPLAGFDLRLACWWTALLLFAAERAWTWAQARRAAA